MEQFIKNAKKQGFSDEQIQAFILKKKGGSSPTEIAQAPRASGGLTENIGNGAINLLKNMLAPFARTAGNIGTAATVLPQAAISSLVGRSNPELGAKLASPDIAGTQTRAAQISEDGVGAIKKQLRDNLAIASYAVPFGRGANIATKALLPGAASGLLQGASEDDATAGSVVGSGVLGAGTAGILSLLGKVAGGLQKGTKNAGEGLIQSQYNLPRSAANSTKIHETVQELADYGVRNIDDVQKVASKVTGDTGAITKVTREAAVRAKPVDMDGLVGITKELADDSAMPIGQDKKFFDFVKKGVQSLYETQGKASASQSGAPDRVLDFIKTLEKKAASISRGRPDYMIPEADKALQRSYRYLADELSERLFTKSGANVNVRDLVKNPEFLAELSEVSPKLAAQASKVNTLSELRSLAAPFVRGAQAARITETGANLATDTAAGAVKGVGKLAQNPLNLLAVPLSTNRFNSAAGGALRAAGNLSLPKASPAVGSALNSLGIAGVRGATKGGEGEVLEESSTEPLDLTSDVEPVVNTKKTSIMDNPKVKAILASPDVSKATKNMFLQEFIKEQTESSDPKTSVIERRNALIADSGLRSLKKVQEIINEDPTILSKQLVPKQFFSRTFQSAAFRAADAIVRLRSGATARKDEYEAYRENALPSFGDDGPTIRFKLEQLKQDFEDASLNPSE